MSERRQYYVYILANRKNGTIYTGITHSLELRVWQHKNGVREGFSSKYGVDRLVYFEVFRNVEAAIAREKKIKAGSRLKKVNLIEAENFEWNDLAADWYA